MEMARHASVTDVLTGIYNRRFFNEILEKQLALAKRHNEPLSLLIADIDHFKNINDTYGHTAGDLALQQAVKFIKIPSVLQISWPGTAEKSLPLLCPELT